MQATTTFGAHRGASGERIPFSTGPIFIDMLVVVTALCLIWICVNNIRATST